MSCAADILKSPLLTIKEEQKQKKAKEEKARWKKPPPHLFRLKYNRVPYDQLPLELEASWFLGEPDTGQYKKSVYMRSQTTIYRQRSMFHSMISVRGEGEHIGDKIGLSITGSHKITFTKKLPDQHIISYETIRNLVHSRFDSARLNPRSSLINAQLFGSHAIDKLR